MIEVLYLYTRVKRGKNKTIYLTEVIVAMGNSIRNKLQEKRDSGLAAKTGAFFIGVFRDLELISIQLGKGPKGHAAYFITVLDDDALRELWAALDPHKIEKMPRAEPYKPWDSYLHETNVACIKTGNRSVMAQVSPKTHPMLFECLNRSQRVGWKINHDIYAVSSWALKAKAEAFNEIWLQTNQEAFKTKLREAITLGEMATKFINSELYHLYTFDFRGRKYATTAYLNETGSDLAKGLLQRLDKKALTKDGFYWMMVNLATNASAATGREDQKKTDKLKLNERFEWAMENEEILISYAKEPKLNRGWMTVDKPWQFLAGCFELHKFRKWQEAMRQSGVEFDEYGYESHIEVYLDGTTNGSQHLCALSLDETTAPYVNLVPVEYPGDLYAYVAENVWRSIEDDVNTFTHKERVELETFIDNMIEIKKRFFAAEPRSTTKKEVLDELLTYKVEVKDTLRKSAAIFWNRISDKKERRKIVKR